MEKITNENPLSHSEDLVANNIEQLKTLFPEIVTEGKIDFKVLQSILGEEIEEGEEYYRFTWAGKAQARREAHKPSTGTLRPCKEDSVDWDSTQNLYIEGDNLEVLKLLQKSYAGKVKMIYIDPPYNTGKDFVYKDNYKDNLKNYQEITGQVDSDGNKLTTNSDSEGRFHSNWLNMMYPRLRLARNLLKDDGVIFMSIDDNEIDNLRKVSDEIFGENNFIARFIHKNNSNKNQANLVSVSCEYFLCYARDIEVLNKEIWRTQKKGTKDIVKAYNQLKKQGLLLNEILDEVKDLYKRPKYAHLSRWNKIDEKGVFMDDNLSREGGAKGYSIINPETGTPCPIPPRGWAKSKEELEELLDNDMIYFGDSTTPPRIKSYLTGDDLSVPDSFCYIDNSVDTRWQKQIFNALIFENPKPLELVKLTMEMSSVKDSIILDFFSGSGTTAHALYDLNADDKGKRKFIQVQLPEPTDEKSEAYKAGYKTISEIGKERIRRAGAKIVNDQVLIIKEKKKALEKMINGELFVVNETYKFPENTIIDDKATSLLQEINHLQLSINNLDTGFKVFKLDSSNIRGWDGNLEGKELEAVLTGYIENTKDSETTVDKNGELIQNPDVRTAEDILYEILLKYGLDLTLAIEEKEIAGKKVFIVGNGTLFICLGNNITSAVAEGIGEWIENLRSEIQETITDTELIKKLIEGTQKCRVVFKDNGFTDVEKTNSVQILKRFGITEIKTL